MPLTPDAYARYYETFGAFYPFRPIFLKWVERNIARLIPSGAPALRILSIGCGTGDMDIPFLEIVAAGVRKLHGDLPISYVGIEPNPDHRRSMSARIAAWPLLRQNAALSAVVHQLSLEQFVDQQKRQGAPDHYDLALISHSLYYCADVPRMLQEAHSLADRLLVLHQSPAGFTEAASFYSTKCRQAGPGSPPVNSHLLCSLDIERMLSGTLRVPYELDLLNAFVDVSPCFLPGAKGGLMSSEGMQILSFLVDDDLAAAPDSVLEQLRAFLAVIAVSDGPRRLLFNPDAVILVGAGPDL